METKKTIIRRRSLSLQLEIALRTAAAMIEKGCAETTKELIKIQLVTLNAALKRERDVKLKQALERVTELEAENAQLKAELARRNPSPADDIRAVLNGGNNVQGI